MTGHRRRTRRYDGEPPARALTRGLLVAALIAAFGWLAVTFYNGVPGRDYTMVQAKLPRVGSLLAHDPIRLGGVRVGQVKSIDLAGDGETLLNLQLEPDAHVPADSQIRIRANGLLGARYVELVPGRSTAALRAGTVIQGGDSALTAGATDALDTFDRQTRGALRPLLGELGTGLEGQGRNTNDLIRAGAREIGPTTQLFTTLNADGAALRALLPGLRAGVQPLDDNRKDIAALIVAGDTALRPLVTERAAVRTTLSAAPSTLRAADAGLRAGRPLLQATHALAAQARRTLPEAPGGLRATAALLREAPAPVRRATKLLEQVRPAVPVALKLTRALDPIATPLARTLGDLVTIVGKVAPYGCDITNFGAVFRSMTGLGTSAGGGPNGPAMQFRLQAAATPVAETLSMVDTSGMVHREGYPKPCEYLAKPYPIVNRPVNLREGR